MKTKREALDVTVKNLKTRISRHLPQTCRLYFLLSVRVLYWQIGVTERALTKDYHLSESIRAVKREGTISTY